MWSAMLACADDLTAALPESTRADPRRSRAGGKSAGVEVGFACGIAVRLRSKLCSERKRGCAPRSRSGATLQNLENHRHV